MKPFETFGARLKRLREERGMLQKDIGDRGNLNRSTISLYELGSHLPGYWALVEMARVLDVSLDYLMLGEEDVHAKHSHDVYSGRRNGDGRPGPGQRGPQDSDMGERLQRDEGFIPGGEKALPRNRT